MAKTCECTSRCGDDPNVAANRVLGCASYRASRNPAELQGVLAQLRGDIQRLRTALQGVVTVMDGMEPDVPWEQRASDEDWDAAKATANTALTETA